MQIEAIFFDLDDTLYPSSSGLWEAIRSRMEKYLIEVMNFPPETASFQQHDLFLKYGTTLRGLEEEYDIDPQSFLQYVHDLPLKEYITADPDLRQMLSQYRQRKIIFTNADSGHANRVLNTLELTGSFEQIIDIRDIHPHYKPQLAAFQKALELADIENPQNCVMIDDTCPNLLTAKEAGLFTIQIGTGERIHGIDAIIANIKQLTEVLPLVGSE